MANYARARVRAGLPTTASLLAGSLLVTALLLLLLAAPSAHADLRFSTQLLSPDEGAYEAQIAIDPQDRATVVWQSDRGIRSRRLAANGTPGAVRTLSAKNAYLPQVATDPQGRATVVWIRSVDSGAYWVQSVHISAKGAPGKVQTLGESGNAGGLPMPKVAVDSHGRATVVWNNQDTGRLHVRRLGTDGTPGALGTLSAVHSEWPQIAIDSRDRATVVWVQSRCILCANVVKSVRIAASGRPELSRSLFASHEDENVYLPKIAFDPKDRATVVWLRRRSFDPDVIYSVRLAANGTPGRIRVLTTAASGPGAFDYPDGPQLAVDPQGRATVVWKFGVGFQIRRIRADGTLERVRTVDETFPENNPQVVVDRRSRATLVWRRSITSPYPITALPVAASGVPGEPVHVADADWQAYPPRLAVDSKGRVSVVWGNGRILSARSN